MVIDNGLIMGCSYIYFFSFNLLPFIVIIILFFLYIICFG